MDVEQQIEANGYDAMARTLIQSRDLTLLSLSSPFGSSEQPAESHIGSNVEASNVEASNVEASLSNSETTAATAGLKQSAPVSETPADGLQQPRAGPTEGESSRVPAENGVSSQTDSPVPNGTAVEDSEAVDQSMSTVPDSQPPSFDLLTSPARPTGVNAISTSSPAEAGVPSSIPTEIQSSNTTADTSQSVMDSASEPPSWPPQRPSDRPTSPQPEAWTPAEAEVQKPQEETVADTTPSAATDAMDTSFSAPPPAPDAAAASAPASVTRSIGLPSPPTQSPPPAPQPPAILAAEKPVAPAAPVPAPAAERTPPAAPSEQAATEVVPVSAVPAPAVPASDDIDQPMTDASPSPTKLARGREEDAEESEPAPKRIKTDEAVSAGEQTPFKVPDLPPPVATSPELPNGGTAAPPAAATATTTNGTSDGDDTVTPARLAHMKKVISNLKKSNASTAFRLPVDTIGLNIPTYFDVVKTPMDLSTIDHKLKQNRYTSISEFVRDFEQIISNSVAFNGPEHGVTLQARKMQNSFNNQMANLPKAGVEEPSKESKKAAKVKQEPTRTAPPRRPSVTPAPPPPAGSARSPKAAPPTPSFAPGPDGIPLIRRDSALDGRPKRAIVPPKRNQDFASGRPKKKKYELQLRFCQEVIKELTNPKHWHFNQYFTHPVDPVALNIPTYFQIIRKPMDLGTIQNKLDNNVYEKAKDVEEDVRLVFKNCYKFNPEGDFVNQCGHQLEDLFNKKWATKDDWIAAREPASEPQSDAEAEDEDEDGSEEEEEGDSEAERNDKIKQLQKQIAEMSKQMGELTQHKKSKKSKSPPTKKAGKPKTGKKEKPAATFPHPGKDKKEKKKTTAASKSKAEKDRYVTFAEKQYISNGIAMLPEKQMQEALKIIQSSVPSLANSDQNEIELDIEEVPNHALLKLLNFVKKYAGPPPDEPKPEPDTYNAPTVPKSKKSKPMSKQEQEAQIEELKGKLGAYAGPVSPNAVPSIETGEESSDDDGDSEESEEE